MHHESNRQTIGSLFAGIGGFDLGFERAGWRTVWQVEIDPIARAVLGDRFPDARRYEDVRGCGAETLAPVDCIVAGFPCQDISNAGTSRRAGRLGLRGERSGLFYEAARIFRELRPEWVVLENVAALLHSNDGEDFQTVVAELADCGYVGLWRVLDAQFFGSPCRRRRIFLVGRLGGSPAADLLFDAGAVEPIPSSFGEVWQPRPADEWAGHTLQASNSASRITLGGQVLVAVQDGWNQMVERRRMSERDGLCLGLDEASLAEVRGAGNAVDPRVAEWIARKILATRQCP